MIDTVSNEQIVAYRERGFLHLPGFLLSHELEIWRRAVDDAVEERREKPQDGTPAGQEDYYGNVFLQMMLLSRTNEAVHMLMHDARLGRLAGTLAGVDGIHIWHDQALIKEPFANATSFHFDVPYWSFDSRDAISIWVALDDATLKNGCLYFLPGSHKLAGFEWTNIGENLGEMFTQYPDFARIEPVAVEAAAGDALFHNGLTAHAAGPNLTTGYRRAMTCAYMPMGSQFNGKQNVLSQEYFSSLEIGDVLDKEEELPLIWRNDAAA